MDKDSPLLDNLLDFIDPSAIPIPSTPKTIPIITYPTPSLQNLQNLSTSLSQLSFSLVNSSDSMDTTQFEHLFFAIDSVKKAISVIGYSDTFSIWTSIFESLTMISCISLILPNPQIFQSTLSIIDSIISFTNQEMSSSPPQTVSNLPGNSLDNHPLPPISISQHTSILWHSSKVLLYKTFAFTGFCTLYGIPNIQFLQSWLTSPISIPSQSFTNIDPLLQKPLLFLSNKILVYIQSSIQLQTTSNHQSNMNPILTTDPSYPSDHGLNTISPLESIFLDCISQLISVPLQNFLPGQSISIPNFNNIQISDQKNFENTTPTPNVNINSNPQYLTCLNNESFTKWNIKPLTHTGTLNILLSSQYNQNTNQNPNNSSLSPLIYDSTLSSAENIQNTNNVTNIRNSASSLLEHFLVLKLEKDPIQLIHILISLVSHNSSLIFMFSQSGRILHFISTIVLNPPKLFILLKVSKKNVKNENSEPKEDILSQLVQLISSISPFLLTKSHESVAAKCYSLISTLILLPYKSNINNNALFSKISSLSPQNRPFYLFPASLEQIAQQFCVPSPFTVNAFTLLFDSVFIRVETIFYSKSSLSSFSIFLSILNDESFWMNISLLHLLLNSQDPKPSTLHFNSLAAPIYESKLLSINQYLLEAIDSIAQSNPEASLPLFLEHNSSKMIHILVYLIAVPPICSPQAKLQLFPLLHRLNLLLNMFPKDSTAILVVLLKYTISTLLTTRQLTPTNNKSIISSRFWVLESAPSNIIISLSHLSSSTLFKHPSNLALLSALFPRQPHISPSLTRLLQSSTYPLSWSLETIIYSYQQLLHYFTSDTDSSSSDKFIPNFTSYFSALNLFLNKALKNDYTNQGYPFLLTILEKFIFSHILSPLFIFNINHKLTSQITTEFPLVITNFLEKRKIYSWLFHSTSLSFPLFRLLLFSLEMEMDQEDQKVSPSNTQAKWPSLNTSTSTQHENHENHENQVKQFNLEHLNNENLKTAQHFKAVFVDHIKNWAK